MTNWLSWILIGFIAGWIARVATGSDRGGCVYYTLIGVLGSVIGGWLCHYFLGWRLSVGFNLRSLAVATVGAVLLLIVASLARKR